MPVVCQIALGDSAGSLRPLGFNSETAIPHDLPPTQLIHTWGVQTGGAVYFSVNQAQTNVTHTIGLAKDAKGRLGGLMRCVIVRCS